MSNFAGHFDGFEAVNIGDPDSPKMIYIGKCCSPEEKEKLIPLLVKYKEVFAWCYDDLKNFMNGKFQHHIPLKEGKAAFRQK